jgi:hypothetical protein
MGSKVFFGGTSAGWLAAGGHYIAKDQGQTDAFESLLAGWRQQHEFEPI